MSGGSLNYIYLKVNDAAQDILSISRKPIHVAFAKHLIKVSKALHDLEWVLSGDSSSPEEEEVIRSVLHPTDELNSVKEEAEIALNNLQDAIKRIKIK